MTTLIVFLLICKHASYMVAVRFHSSFDYLKKSVGDTAGFLHKIIESEFSLLHFQ